MLYGNLEVHGDLGLRTPATADCCRDAGAYGPNGSWPLLLAFANAQARGVSGIAVIDCPRTTGSARANAAMRAPCWLKALWATWIDCSYVGSRGLTHRRPRLGWQALLLRTTLSQYRMTYGRYLILPSLVNPVTRRKARSTVHIK